MSCAMRQNTFRFLIQSVLHDSRRRSHKFAEKCLKPIRFQAASSVALGHGQWKAWPDNCRYSDESTVLIVNGSHGTSSFTGIEGGSIRRFQPDETFCLSL